MFVPSLVPLPASDWYFLQDNPGAPSGKSHALYLDSGDRWAVKTYAPDGSAHSFTQYFETREDAAIFLARLFPVWKISSETSDTPFIPVLLWVYMQPCGQGFLVYDPATKEELTLGKTIFGSLVEACRMAQKLLAVYEREQMKGLRKNISDISRALTRMDRSARKAATAAPFEGKDEDEDED